MSTPQDSLIRGPLLALAGFAFFALHDALIKSLAAYSVFQIVFFAVLFSHVPFVFYLATVGDGQNLRPARPFWVGFRTLCMVGSALFAFYAFGHLPLAQTYAVLFTTPLMITVLAIPILGERVRIFRWFAVALGLGGMLIALRPDSGALQAGHLAALAGALCSATSAVLTRKLGASERSATLILYPLLANILLTGGLLYFVYRPMPFADLAKMAGIGCLALLGQLFVIRAYRAAPAALVAPFQYSQILWAVFYSMLWFNETPDRYVLIGSVVIICAGLLIVWRESRLGVSLNRPFLRSHNSREVLGPSMTPSESGDTA
ncbi:MAG: DMT family transporter [Gammaproteobacteria bacterium]